MKARVRAALAVAVVGAAIYLVIVETIIPEAYWVALGMIITFYFTQEN